MHPMNFVTKYMSIPYRQSNKGEAGNGNKNDLALTVAIQAALESQGKPWKPDDMVSPIIDIPMSDKTALAVLSSQVFYPTGKGVALELPSSSQGISAILSALKKLGLDPKNKGLATVITNSEAMTKRDATLIAVLHRAIETAEGKKTPLTPHASQTLSLEEAQGEKTHTFQGTRVIAFSEKGLEWLFSQAINSDILDSLAEEKRLRRPPRRNL